MSTLLKAMHLLCQRDHFSILNFSAFPFFCPPHSFQRTYIFKMLKYHHLIWTTQVWWLSVIHLEGCIWFKWRIFSASGLYRTKSSQAMIQCFFNEHYPVLTHFLHSLKTGCGNMNSSNYSFVLKFIVLYTDENPLP